MALRPKNPAPRPAPRLYLMTPPVADPSSFSDQLASALDAGDVAAVLLRLAEADERTLINRVKALAPAVQDKGAALLLDGRADLVARGGADGLPGTNLLNGRKLPAFVTLDVEPGDVVRIETPGGGGFGRAPND